MSAHVTDHCVICRRPRLDLGRPSDLATARFLFDELCEVFSGRVDVQADLVWHLWDSYGISHGTTHRFVDGLARTGHVRVEYYRETTLKKRVIAVRRP